MKKLLLFLLFTFLITSFTQINLLAGTTGKIAGKVTDKDTGEPLIGINVMIQGTTMGAATDLDGNYVINNVEPGVYSLVFSGVGYQKQIVTEVRVSTDYTTRINIELSIEAIGLETIVVEAKNPMIRKDLTSSKTVVDDSQIEALPVESIDQILTLQAGITKGASGELHIRGGRSTEIAYNINGVSTNNPFDFGRSVQISTNAVQELSVVSGTFNAEYGNALSGVVNTITKEGGDKYRFTLSYYTGDYASSHDDIFYDINDINPIAHQVAEGTLGGPVPGLTNIVSFFFSGRYDKNDGWLFGQRQHTIYDSVYKNVNDPNDIRVSQTGDGASVPMNPSTDISATGKLTFRPVSTVKINYDVVYSDGEYKTYSHDQKYNPDNSYQRLEWGLLNSLEVRHAVSNSTFYSLKGAYNLYDFKRYLFPLLDNSGTPVSYKPGDDYTQYKIDRRYQPSHKSTKVTPYTFASGGTVTEHYYQRSSTLDLRFDLTSQVNVQHELKFGAQTKFDDMDFENFFILYDTVTYRTPTILPPTSASHDLYSRSPQQISAYLQDKMEFESMIINAGLRFDYFNSKAKYAPDDMAPTANLTDAEEKTTFSPRLGISFPITDQGIIHFSYGHFYQLPPYRFLYTNPNFKTVSGVPVFGNANLNPERTVTYEIGLQQQLSETIAFNVTGFYKDVRDLLALQQIRASSSLTFQKYVNKDYGNIKGITFSLTKRKFANDLFGVSLDYTFQVAEGNNTSADAFFIDLNSGRQSEKVPVPLDWDQSHNLNGVISLGSDRDWLVTVIGSISSGLPYSPQIPEQEIYLGVNSERKPVQTNVDLLVEKSFDLSDMLVTVFLKVYNLFDTLNERFVYDDTGRATYSLEQTKGGPQETNRIAATVPGVKSADEYFVRPQYYSAPREVRIGLSLEY